MFVWYVCVPPVNKALRSCPLFKNKQHRHNVKTYVGDNEWYFNHSCISPHSQDLVRLVYYLHLWYRSSQESVSGAWRVHTSTHQDPNPNVPATCHIHTLPVLHRGGLLHVVGVLGWVTPLGWGSLVRRVTPLAIALVTPLLGEHLRVTTCTMVPASQQVSIKSYTCPCNTQVRNMSELPGGVRQSQAGTTPRRRT